MRHLVMHWKQHYCLQENRSSLRCLLEEKMPWKRVPSVDTDPCDPGKELTDAWLSKTNSKTDCDRYIPVSR